MSEPKKRRLLVFQGCGKKFSGKKIFACFFLNLSYLMDYVSGTILLCNTQLEYVGAVTALYCLIASF